MTRTSAVKRNVVFAVPFVAFTLFTIGYGVFQLIASNPDSWTLVLTVIAGVIIIGPFQIRLGRGSAGSPQIGISIAMLALLPIEDSLFLNVSIWAIGFLISQLAMRGSPLLAAYATGLCSAGAVAFVAIQQAFADLGIWLLPTFIVAATAFYAIVLLGGYLRRRFCAWPKRDSGFSAISPVRVGVVILVVAITATLEHYVDSSVILWLEHDPEADLTPFVVLLAASLFYVLAQRTRYADMERRLRAIVDAAISLPRETGESLVSALRSRAQAIVQAGQVEVRSTMPGRNEIGAPVSLAPGDTQYVVASEKNDGITFSREDERSLATLAHLASEAARIQSEVNTLEQRANSDPLTGLPNYGAFQDALVSANENRPYHEGIALLFIDLDDFKKLNDNFGHRAGDALLRAVAERLQRASGGGDFVSRVGGDEFVVILTGLVSIEQAKDSADRIMEKVSERISIEGHDMRPLVSAGLAYSSHRELDAQTLVEDADRAMLQVKRSRQRGGPLERSSVSISSHRSTRTNDIVARAITGNRLVVAFQPIVDIEQDRIWAFEALVRYVDPELGPISPPSLVARAKSLGLMNELTTQVLTKALDATEEFRRIESSINCLTVNLELGQISESELGPFVRESARAHSDISLCIELNERSLRSVTDELRRAAEVLQEAGVAIALDDYGSDDSSVGALVHFPMNILKIDKSLIDDLSDARQREVIKALQGFGDNLGYTVIVEGVETPAMLATMTELGVRSAQGFHFGRPLPFAQTVDRLRQWGNKSLIG